MTHKSFALIISVSFGFVLLSTLGPAPGAPLELISADEQFDGNFGSSVSGVPDVNGDGRGDVVVGAWLEYDPDLNPISAGRAYIYDGATGAPLRLLFSPNEETIGYFGISVSGIPDINGDGRGDVVIGAPNEGPAPGPFNAGRAYIFDGATGALLRTLISPNEVIDGSFGNSVSGVPDVNGDGIGDIVIGAEEEDPGSSPYLGGRAYIFNGATGAHLQTLISPNEEDYGGFGHAVSGVPDLNGDGRGDVVVGAASEDPGVSPDRSGRAYIFDGATGAHIQTLNSPNEQTGGYFGEAVSGVPDVNGDGLGDVIIGARFESVGSSPGNAGSAYIFDGATGSLLHTLASLNQEYGGLFGSSVSGISDFNEDGRGDVVIGAPGESPGASLDYAGRAYIFDGSTGAHLQTLASPNVEHGDFGISVSGIPEVDGDGRGDVVVGAPSESPGASPDSAGRAYIFHSSPPPPSIPPPSLLPPFTRRDLNSPNEEVDGRFGCSVSGVPDVNGDGRGDIVVGSEAFWWEFHDPYGGGADGVGSAYIFDGSTGALLHTLASPNEEVGGYFGVSVSGVPDVNGDGRGDVVVGAFGEDPGASPEDVGRAYIFNGATGALLQTLASPNEEVGNVFGGNGFGISVSGISDVNGDGRGDVVVGAHQEDPGVVEDAGAAYIFDGATGALLQSLASPNEDLLDRGLFGFSVSGVPDINGDGRGDVVVGAYREDPGAMPEDSGAAYIFDGATGALLHTLTSPNAEENGQFGVSVAGAPDVNGDGRGDVVIGAHSEDFPPGDSGNGRAYILDGATGALLHSLTSPNHPDEVRLFGRRVSAVQDINGDGRGDAIIGSYADDTGEGLQDAGRVHNLDGRTGALLQTLTSSNQEYRGRFGLSVSGVPDINGDGLGDVVIGADDEDPGSSPNGAGRAYIFYSTLDTDSDGVADSIEDGGPNGGDGNNDGILDRDQANAVTLPNAEDGRYVTIVVAESHTLSGVNAVRADSPPTAPPEEVVHPLGLFEFSIAGVTPGGSATAELILPDEFTANSYFKYGGRPGKASPHWHRFMFDETTGAVIDGARITLWFVDGGRGDGDIGVNGIVKDPSGPAVSPFGVENWNLFR